jgi:hypothetical protein
LVVGSRNSDEGAVSIHAVKTVEDARELVHCLETHRLARFLEWDIVHLTIRNADDTWERCLNDVEMELDDDDREYIEEFERDVEETEREYGSTLRRIR